MEKIEINECGEPLVDIAKVCPDLIIDLDDRPNGAKRKAYLRKSVAQMVCKAKSFLPKGMTFIIGDAWRPKEIQDNILKSFELKFQKEHPNWSKIRVLEEVGKYAAPSSGLMASGHMSGGAVDLRLWKNGRKVPMRSSKLTYQENSLSVQPKLPKNLHGNRQMMFDALTKAGLSNYPLEFWHWSYGDVMWAIRNNKKTAIYGTIEKLPKS